MHQEPIKSANVPEVERQPAVPSLLLPHSVKKHNSSEFTHSTAACPVQHCIVNVQGFIQDLQGQTIAQ